jgi:chaperone required for assembly of F1-ATPase
MRTLAHLMSGSTRRFYRKADLLATEKGYQILLDGRTMKTPAGADLVLPTQALARAVVDEWLGQGDVIRTETLPATRLAATAIDLISVNRQAVVDELIGRADFDLLFYRASEPPDLTFRQEACWQPLLDWATGTWGSPFNVTTGVMPVSQPAGMAAALASAVDLLGDMELTGLANVAQTSGSLIIALALAAERIDAAAACEAALLDESFQTERWGMPQEILERRQHLTNEIVFADTFIAWCRNIDRDAGRSGRSKGSVH